jgi:hypothetical protein
MATTKKKPTPAQVRARKLFAERAKAGAFKRKVGARKKVATSGVKKVRKTSKAPSPAQLAARAKFVAMVRARAKGKKNSGRRRNVAGDSSVKSPTRTSSDVRSPTRTATSTEAQTSGNVTVTGGAGRGATTRVDIHTAAPRGTKAQVGKKKKNPVIRSTKAACSNCKSHKVLVNVKGTSCASCGVRRNPIRFTEAEARHYAPKIRGLSSLSSAPRLLSTARRKKAPSKKRFKKAGVFGGSGFLGLGRSRQKVRVNARGKGRGGFGPFVRGEDLGYFRAKHKSHRRAAKRLYKKGDIKGAKYHASKLGVTKSLGWPKRNPSPASVFTEFRGKEVRSKSKATAATGTPKVLANLGALKELDVDGRTKRFGGRAVLAADGRKKLHIVNVKMARPNPPGEIDYGEIRRIMYYADKPEVQLASGDDPKEKFQYNHHFSRPYPHLIVDSEGYPVIEGGNYKISADGILD